MDDLRGGYTQEQLEKSFDLVKPLPHWKAKIDEIVPHNTDLELLKFAIIYFTGSVAEITSIPGGHRVKAAGYWAAVGA